MEYIFGLRKIESIGIIFVLQLNIFFITGVFFFFFDFYVHSFVEYNIIACLTYIKFILVIYISNT